MRGTMKLKLLCRIVFLSAVPYLKPAECKQRVTINGGFHRHHRHGETENHQSRTTPRDRSRHLHVKNGPCGVVQDLPHFGPSDPTETILSFFAFGDIPYYESERYCLNAQLRNISLAAPDGPSFMLHVGDIKKGSLNTDCPVSAFRDIAEIFAHRDNAQSYDPGDIFFTPGDNEWSDCDDPNDAWTKWMQHFGPNNPYGFGNLSSGDVTVKRQTGVERLPGVDRSENLAFLTKGVLVAGVNLIGGSEPVNAALRLEQNFEWLQYQLAFHSENMVAAVLFGHSTLEGSRANNFGNPLKELLRTQYSDLPVIYIHGDLHQFCADFAEKDLNPRFIDVQVPRGTKAPPLLISLLRNTNDGSLLFDIDERGGSYPLGCPRVEEQTWNEPILVPLPTTSTPLVKVRWNPPFPDGTSQLGLCEGDCDGDSECRDGLVCFDRKLNETVPGCTGYGTDQMDYCIQATPASSPSPTPPTPSPTPLTPSPTPPTPCRDDPNWKYLDKRGRIKYCSWVGSNESRLDTRCGKIGIDGTPASEACRRTCGLCTE